MLALKSQQSTAPFSLSSATESTLISSKQSREKHCLQAEPESGNFNEVREYLSSIREDLQRK